MKTLLTILIVCVFTTVFAQTKETAYKKQLHKHIEELNSPAKKVQYQKFIAIDPGDMQVVIEAFNQWKRLQMFDPATTGENKVATYKNLENYTTELLKRVRLDSIMVKIDTVKQH